MREQLINKFYSWRGVSIVKLPHPEKAGSGMTCLLYVSEERKGSAFEFSSKADPFLSSTIKNLPVIPSETRNLFKRTFIFFM